MEAHVDVSKQTYVSRYKIDIIKIIKSIKYKFTSILKHIYEVFMYVGI